MYLPEHFRRADREEAVALIRRVVLAELVTWDGAGLCASSVPLLYEPAAGPEGALLGHLARANPQWRTAAEGVEALAIFRGPQAYVSPSWYPAKAEHGRVVPTWNYAGVQVHGELIVHDDQAWKRDLVTRLTEQQERSRPQPWAVTDAPGDYVTAQLGAIVGIELRITRLEAKWKLSQNQPLPNRLGAATGLEAEGTAEAQAVAGMMRDLLEPGEP